MSRSTKRSYFISSDPRVITHLSISDDIYDQFAAEFMHVHNRKTQLENRLGGWDDKQPHIMDKETTEWELKEVDKLLGMMLNSAIKHNIRFF